MISVIIPVYNTEKYLRRCLDSVLEQTYQDFEIIIVNDCSPDNSATILNEYVCKDSRIHVIENERNAGQMVTRSVGYRAARGEFLTFLDSDDFLPSDALEVLLRAMSGEDDIVVGNLNFISCDGNVSIHKNRCYRYTSPEFVYEALLTYKLSHSLCGKLFRRSLICDHTYVTASNMTNGEDALLFYQLARNVKSVNVIDAQVYNYVQNPQSSTNTYYTENKINSLFKGLSYQYSLIEKYPDLRQLFENKITRSVCMIYSFTTEKRILDKCCQQYGFVGFYSLQRIVKAFSATEAIKTLLKIHVIAPWKRLTRVNHKN